MRVSYLLPHGIVLCWAWWETPRGALYLRPITFDRMAAIYQAGAALPEGPL